MMQTAVEYDPYSPSFFLTSAVTESSAMQMANASAISMDDKEMISPSVWTSSATEMSSPSIYSSSGSSIDSRDMSFTRSTTPSPDTLWSDYRTQVQCLPPSQPSQHSASIFSAMTDVLPPSRPSNPAPQKSHDGGSKHKTTSIFNPIKFFPRASPPPSTPPPPNSTLSHGRHSSEPYAATPGNKAYPPAPLPPAWSFVPQSKTQPPNALQFAAQDRRVSPFRSPRYWFTPGKFFASTGAQ